MPATGLRFGALAFLYRNSGASFATPTWNDIGNVGDVTTDIDWNEAEASTRGSGEAVEPTLQKFEVDFEMLEDMDDADFLAIRAAFLAKTKMDWFLCSGAYNAQGETYVRSEAKVMSFKKTEPLKGVNKYAVKIKRCYTTNAIQAGIVA